MSDIEKWKINADVEKGAIIINEDLVLVYDLASINLPKISKSKVYIIALIVEGKASFYNNGQWHVAQQNDLVAIIPEDIIEDVLLSVNCKLYCIAISPKYIQRIMPIATNSWHLETFFSKNTLCTLTRDEAIVFCQYYDLIYAKMRHQSTVQEKVINFLVMAWYFDLHEILNKYTEIDMASYTSGDLLFQKFIDLLQSGHPKNRSVTFYADCLCITPKYLSAVCKKSCGQTAMKLIDRYVVKDIEYLLKFSDKSIKEISVELDFPNLSFFGTYVRKHFGCSPKEVRRQFTKEGKLDK